MFDTMFWQPSNTIAANVERPYLLDIGNYNANGRNGQSELLAGNDQNNNIGGLIERFFNKLKYFRRIATRNDKLGSTFLAMAKLACIRLRLRHNESIA